MEPQLWQLWIAGASAAITGASVAVAIAAYVQTRRAEDRARRAVRTELYLLLKSRFMEVHRDLPPEYVKPSWRPTSLDELGAVRRYWYHCFDEWYVTNRLNEDYMKTLWDNYFSRVIGLRHNGLRDVLHKEWNPEKISGLYKEWFEKVLDIWKQSHPTGPQNCAGFGCREGHFGNEDEPQPSRFAARALSAEPDDVAPDGSDVRVLLRLERGSMAHFELGPDRVSRAVAAKTVEEIWYFVGGRGQMWRKLGDMEETVEVYPGVCITIPVGTHFQFRTIGHECLVRIGVTMPPWPGVGEADVVDGKWEPRLED